MKKIKIFIASSAELNEDKQMFDLYFSDKNKLYRDRNIDFDQRTWMDFSSSLNEGRLQDRYNDYIRECDIVIFLFHTRMGRYTKEELEVAHEIYLKTKAAKPKIFVYFKEEGSLMSLSKILNLIARRISDTSATCIPIMMICVSSSTNNCRFWRMKALSSPIR